MDIYSGTYGNDDVEVFQPEEVMYHLAGRDGVFMKVRLRLTIIIRTRAALETGRVFSPAIVHIFQHGRNVSRLSLHRA